MDMRKFFLITLVLFIACTDTPLPTGQFARQGNGGCKNHPERCDTVQPPPPPPSPDSTPDDTVPDDPPPPPPPPTGYVRVAGYDWSSFGSMNDVRATDMFWWNVSGEDVYTALSLVPDATFGQVLRMEYKQSDVTIYNPRGLVSFAPIAKMWLRWRIRWAPGWTTAGDYPAGYANSWKMAFWLWDGYGARGQIEISNTTQYILGFGFTLGGTYCRGTETTLPGSQSWGHVTSEWTTGEWWEYVVYYEKTGTTSARQHWWRRKLTDITFTYMGIELTGASCPTPLVRAIELPANKNKMNPATMYNFWSSFEVVDGSVYPNPFGMPNL